MNTPAWGPYLAGLRTVNPVWVAISTSELSLTSSGTAGAFLVEGARPAEQAALPAVTVAPLAAEGAQPPAQAWLINLADVSGPPEAARRVAQERRRIKQPLLIELVAGGTTPDQLVPLARAVSAAGADAIVLNAPEVHEACAALAAIYGATTLPLIARCSVETPAAALRLFQAGASAIVLSGPSTTLAPHVLSALAADLSESWTVDQGRIGTHLAPGLHLAPVAPAAC